ncbi:MAG: beta-N-acetylhexosaminidase [Flaviaesturariibacter sp.]|nr:beta-N-acetylhexosaminidase [Flaviaesturariibacter sp.]
MKKLILFTILIAFAGPLTAQPKPALALIPEPVSVTRKTGVFSLPSSIVIETTDERPLAASINFLKQRFTQATGRSVRISRTVPAGPHIQLVLNRTPDAKLGKEGYRLVVTGNLVTIRANAPAGIFYGTQTLVQLFPKEIESAVPVAGVRWEAPAVDITDYPRFGWRGLMFDVVRHYFTKDEVKHFIDDMVRYKYNLLHLHLTDDEGWRIEIKGLPRLTEVGAWRVEKIGSFGAFTPPTPDEPRTYGGFYTQDDIREIVRYAKDRFVDILPEIDVPGHSLAAVASYPELSCTPEAKNYLVRSGERIMDWSHGAPPIALVDNTLCPANEKVYAFLDTVMSQLAQLFPFDYIHVGGDETPKNFWKQTPEITALMQREGLKTYEEVQSYFEKRLEKIVESKGKKFMGWDEILEGGLAPSAAVMSWRGMKGGMEAARLKHEVVMSPSTYAYLDYMQSDAVMEPRVYASLRLRKTYEFEPAPDSIDARYVKGGQANLWTEQIYNFRQVQYMLWPRAFAIAESVWSPASKKSWSAFFPKVEAHFNRFNVSETKYSPAVYDPAFSVKRAPDGTLRVELATEVEGLDIHYTFDNSFPDRFYPTYTTPLTPPKDATTLRVITYRGKTQVGRLITMPVEELEKRAPKKK